MPARKTASSPERASRSKVGPRHRLSHALLRGNGLTDGAAPSLRGLVAAQRLRVLDLSRNSLGGAALAAILAPLKKRTGASGMRLQRLCLENNAPLSGASDAGDDLGEALNAAARDAYLPHLFEIRVTFRDAATPLAMRLGCRTPGNPYADNPLLPRVPPAPPLGDRAPRASKKL